jgi:large conductance mechanosensitive channel
MGVIGDFKHFLLGGTFIDTAVALAIGVAFTAMITSFVNDLISPSISVLMNGREFSQMYFEIRNAKFYYGKFINAAITFLLVALVVFFGVVRPFMSAKGK